MVNIKTIKVEHPLANNCLGFLALCALALIVHAVVLKFIFPGYYDPLWPLHSDFYLPANISNSGLGFLHYINKARPSGMAFFFLVGNFGIHGSIAAVIAMTLLNAVITAAIARKILAIPFGFQFLVAYIIYLLLLFSHPYFYSFYAHDAFSQLSYFLLLNGGLLFSYFFTRYFKLAFFLLFMSLLLAFLAKETFGITALVISFAWFIYHQKTSIKAAIVPFVSVVLALCLTFGYNFLKKSVFVTNTNQAYKLDLSPISILSQWFEYVSLGYNMASLFGLLLIGVLVCYRFQVRGKVSMLFFAACLLGFITALLPNSLLANHVHPGYSWTGAYLAFAIIFLVVSPQVIHFWSSPQFGVCLVFIFIAGFSNHAVNMKKYSGSTNQWVLIQEDIQRNLLTSLQMLVKDLDKDKSEHVLITGISFPYEPFHYANSLNGYLANKDVKIDVLSYSEAAKLIQKSQYISVIPVSNEIALSKYTRIWLFGNDGRFLYVLKNEKLDNLSILKNYILFPEVGEALGGGLLSLFIENSHANPVDGYKLMNIGNAYAIYQQTEMAVELFKQSAKLIPDNPYPWYMAGIELEKQKKLEESKAYLSKAVELDPDNLNENFSAALARVTSQK